MSIFKSVSFRNLLNLSQQQLAITILVFILSAVLAWIVSRGLFDLIRYLVFRFLHRDSFVPRSWLFVTIVGIASLFVISRGQVARATTVELVADLDAQPVSPKSQPTRDLISTLSCAVVVAGLILRSANVAEANFDNFKSIQDLVIHRQQPCEPRWRYVQLSITIRLIRSRFVCKPIQRVQFLCHWVSAIQR